MLYHQNKQFLKSVRPPLDSFNIFDNTHMKNHTYITKNFMPTEFRVVYFHCFWANQYCMLHNDLIELLLFIRK